ncbi:MAG: hypothetical protein IKC71_02125 [Clostridia bacterium]|nr:hypothetical protein [Clostridia bacterium]
MEKVKEKELLEEIKILLKDTFVARFLESDKIIMQLLNGQKFLISVKELTKK